VQLIITLIFFLGKLSNTQSQYTPLTHIPSHFDWFKQPIVPSANLSATCTAHNPHSLLQTFNWPLFVLVVLL
jgi:hypothetical protein